MQEQADHEQGEAGAYTPFMQKMDDAGGFLR
jgi:hypothetical protein